MALATPRAHWAGTLPRLSEPDWAGWRAFVRYEFLIPRRSRLGLALLLLCVGAGLIAGFGAGLGPTLAAYRAWRLGVLIAGFAALPLMAVAARLDAIALATDAVDSRPRAAVQRLLARFVGNFLFVLLAYAVLIGAAWLIQLLTGGALPAGSGPRFSLGAPWHAFAAGVPALLYISALAYCVTVLCPNLLAVAIVALYWLLVLMGRDYLSRIFDFTLTQNALPYLLLTAGLLALTMQVTRWRAGVGRRLSPALLATAVVLLLWGLGSARTLVMTRHDPPFHPKPLTQAMAGQNIRNGFVPGFWLPDQHGRRTGLHDLGTGPVLVVFWSPARPDSVAALAQAQDMVERFGDHGLRVVAICLADDWSVSRRFARERGYRFPMVTDTGCHWAEKLDTSAPLAEAYEVNDLPAVVLADATRRIVMQWQGHPEGTWVEAARQLGETLAQPAGGVTPGG